MDKQVTVYSTPQCHFCHQLKEFLTEKNIEFKEVDVAADQQAREEMVKLTGQMGVPVTIIGDEAVIGFNQPKISELLGIAA